MIDEILDRLHEDMQFYDSRGENANGVVLDKIKRCLLKGDDDGE